MASTIGNLLITLTAETSAFSRGLQDAKKLSFETSAAIVDSLKSVGAELGRMRFDSAGQFRKSAEIAGGVVAGIGTAIIGASVVVSKEVAEQVKSMEKLSQSYGLSIAQISSLRVASKLTGVDMETLTAGLGRMARAAAATAEGSTKQTAAFKNLGVSVTDGAGHLRPMQDLLLDIAGRFSKLQDGTGKTALAMQLFGRSGAALIPFFNRGAEGIQQMLDLSDQLGLTWSEKDARAAEVFQQGVEILDLKSTALKENFVKGLLPALDSLVGAFASTDKSGVSVAQTIGEVIGNAVKYTTVGVASLVAEFRELLVVADLRKWGKDAQDAFDKIESGFQKFAHDVLNPKPVAIIGGTGGATPTAQPTFSSLVPDKSIQQLMELLNKSREELNKAAGDPFLTAASNIQHLQDAIRAFESENPSKIFSDLNKAWNDLQVDKLRLLAKGMEDLNGQMAAARRNQIDSVLSLPTVAPAATGDVLAQRQLYDLGNDMNAQNRERMQIFEQTRTPMEKYAEDLQKLNVLYADKSSEEYTRAVADLDEKLREQYDPTIRLKKSLDDIALAYSLGAMNAEAMSRAIAKVNADIALSRTVTRPQNGIPGIKQGVGAGAASIASQWGGIPAETAQATIQAAQRMQGAFTNFFTSIALGTQSIGKAFQQLGLSIVSSIVEACAQMLAKWLITHVIMAAISKAFGVDDNSATHAATVIASNVSIAQSNAGVAASEEFVWVLGQTGDIFQALAMATVADGIGQGFVAQASMAEGGYLPRDMVIQAHKGETVLPAKLTSFLMGAASSPQMGNGHMALTRSGGSGSSSRMMGDMHFNINGAGDPSLTANKVGNVVQARMNRALRAKL